MLFDATEIAHECRRPLIGVMYSHERLQCFDPMVLRPIDLRKQLPGQVAV